MDNSGIPLPQKVQISDNVLFQHLNNECVLLDMKSEKYFGLNELGGRAWEILSEDGDTDKAIAILLNEYDIDEATLRRDLAILLSELKQENLIVAQ